MDRVLNRIIVVIVASAFLAFAPGCSGKDKKPQSENIAEDEGNPDEDPTLFPDPALAGDPPTALASDDLPDPNELPSDDPSSSQLEDATVSWVAKDPDEIDALIDALIDRETAADPSAAEIDALDRLYEEHPTPPDPSQT